MNRPPGLLTPQVPTDSVWGVSEPKTLAERLRSAREERGLGVNELNRLVALPGGAELGNGYISRVETGDRKNIEAVYAAAIAAVLGVRPEWLISGTGPRKFSSGQIPSVSLQGPPKPNLERVIAKMNRRGRWNPSTIAAARAQDVDAPPGEWPDVLDGIQAGLSGPLNRLNR